MVHHPHLQNRPAPKNLAGKNFSLTRHSGKDAPQTNKN